MYSMAPMSAGSRWINGRDEAALAGRWWRNPAPTSAIRSQRDTKGPPEGGPVDMLTNGKAAMRDRPRRQRIAAATPWIGAPGGRVRIFKGGVARVFASQHRAPLRARPEIENKGRSTETFISVQPEHGATNRRHTAFSCSAWRSSPATRAPARGAGCGPEKHVPSGRREAGTGIGALGGGSGGF